ncbi:MAG: DUF1805 domain-containing protein [Desulfurococcaceae archaeon]|uniref:DUF1805 domain-containing protein n=1 Tax=Staphylothermus marinus TaxID=2280 RepID=A0A7C4D8M2_STAMA
MNEIPYSSVRLKIVEADGNKLLGVEIELPNSPPLVLIRGSRGFVMCGYLDIDTAEKLGAIAVKVRGVKNVEEMLEKEICEVTSKARDIGFNTGVKVKDIIKYL